MSTDATARFLHDAARGDLTPAGARGHGGSGGVAQPDTQVMGGVFSTLVRLRFREDVDVRELARYIIEWNARKPDEAIPVREGQAMLRVVLGEHDLGNYVDEATIDQICLVVSVWILRDLELSDERLAEIVAGVRAWVEEHDKQASPE
jgi:hypothetical protein